MTANLVTFFYKYTCKNDPSKIYIGSTGDLNRRVRVHRHGTLHQSNKFYDYVKTLENGLEDMKLEVLSTKFDLSREERYKIEGDFYLSEKATLNEQIPNGYLQHDNLKNYKKAWYEKNKEELNKKCHERYEILKTQIAEERRQPWTCEACLITLTITHKARHLKTCKGVPKVIDPDKLFTCELCKATIGKKHKARHIKLCKEKLGL